jgi:regulatory protein
LLLRTLFGPLPAGRFPDEGRLWHKNGAMALFKGRRAPPPLSEEKLTELALRYVGRFATTRAKLRAYLQRKVRERGWDGTRPPNFEVIADRFASQGYVDDEAYALAKSRALTGRGYGTRRVDQALRLAGVEEDDGVAARELASDEAVESALRFAARRRLGPFAEDWSADPRDRQKAVAAMVRAGHSFGLSNRIVRLRPGAPIDREQLADFT